MKNCLDIGIIQSFLDGELASGEVTRVSDHIGDCDSCAMLLSQAEDENAVVFPALAREFDAMVPTQRLWARIEDSIETEKASAPWWEKAYAVFVTLINPQVGAFAALLIVVGLFAMYKLSGPSSPGDRAGLISKAANAPTIVNVDRPAPAALSGPDSSTISAPSRTYSRPTVENASYSVPSRKPSPSTNNDQQPTVIRDASYVPGEESYVKTIASLNKSVGDQDPNVMSASQQVSYARNMAVVDDTIKRMRSAVKKDPKSETAKQMLSSAYQNKIDLLNSVAQKEDLVASLK
ncbi:MAG TPA: hypothetical protein VGJ02_10890 [Pyrinomonadaceae bacterium]|jgi:hypothetical protein